jgi:hypothetical protein
MMQASNGLAAGELEFYDSADSLKICGAALAEFPANASDAFTWQLGSEHPKDRFAFFFRFRVSLTNASGTCAISLRFNNNQPGEDSAISEFSIIAEPAGINNLGRLLNAFSELETEMLHWDGIDGELN